MCVFSSKKQRTPIATVAPAVVTTEPAPEIKVPTQADAEVSKSYTAAKNKASGVAVKNIKTSPRGLLDDAQTKKKGLLGA